MHPHQDVRVAGQGHVSSEVGPGVVEEAVDAAGVGDGTPGGRLVLPVGMGGCGEARIGRFGRERREGGPEGVYVNVAVCICMWQRVGWFGGGQQHLTWV